MRRVTLFARLFPPALALMGGAVVAVALFGNGVADRTLRDEARASLRQSARLFDQTATRAFADRAPKADLCAALTDDRFAVALVAADRNPLCVGGEEIRRLLEGALKEGVGLALSGAPVEYETDDFLALALPVVVGGRVRAAAVSVRPAPPPIAADPTVWGIGTAAVIAAAALLALWQRSSLAPEMEALAQGAARFALSRFDRPVPAGRVEEFARTADAMNRMGAELSHRLAEASESSLGGEAILTCLQEGVLAVDPDGIVIRMNPAARRLLRIGTEAAEGARLADLLPTGELMRTVEEALAAGVTLEREVVSEAPPPRILHLSATPLTLEKGAHGGIVVTLADVTDLRRLENLRRDFAANVSHELRTPITSIRGFVETLKEGAIDDPAEAARFLSIIERQAVRLSAIIEDLLDLARVERGEEGGERALLSPQPVRPILAGVVDDLSPKGDERGVTLALDCSADLVAPLNKPLFERAVANLVDNGIAYSEPGGKVTVTATLTGGALFVAVRDVGIGIDKGHLARIFERFYRVDPARSRTLGGTGLGLSIVKHAALAHNGRVTVHSVPGEGSVFTLVTPT